MSNQSDLEKRVKLLEEKLKIAEKHILDLSSNMQNMPSRMEFNSLQGCGQSASIFDGLFT